MLFRRRGTRRCVLLMVILCATFELMNHFVTVSTSHEMNSKPALKSVQRESDQVLNELGEKQTNQLPVQSMRHIQSTNENDVANEPVQMQKQVTNRLIPKEGPWNQWAEKCASDPKQPTFYNHTEFGFNIEERDICQGEVYLLMFVQSKADHRDRRDVIRRTYGSLKNFESYRVTLIFVLGMPSVEQQKAVVQESQQYRDIIQSNHLEHYRNLTYSHLSAFNWILRNCKQAKFVLKLDDDTFVNLPHVITLLTESLKNRNNFFYGHKAEVNKPIREKGIKWTVTLSEWPAENYPDHCKGFGYIMSSDVIEKLLYCSYYVPYFWIDDVFVSGELRRKIGAELQPMYSGFEYDWLMPHHGSEQINDYIFLVGRYNELFKRIWYKMWRASILNYFK